MGSASNTTEGQAVAAASPSDERDALLRALLSLPGVAVLVVDRQLMISRANSSFAALSNRTPREVEGQPFASIAPIAAPELAMLVDEALRGGQPLHGRAAPYEWADLVLDLVPLDLPADPTAGPLGGRVVVVASDTRRVPFDAPGGALHNRRVFTQVSRALSGARVDDADATITGALALIADMSGADRVYTRVLSADETRLFVAHEYRREGLPPLQTETPAEMFDAAQQRLRSNEAVVLGTLDELPADGDSYRAGLVALGIGAMIGVPMLDGDACFGYLMCVCSTPRRWSASIVARMRQFGEMTAAVLARARAEAALRDRLSFEQLLSSATAPFVDVAEDRLDAEIERALAVIGAARGLSRAVVLHRDPRGDTLSRTHQWRAPGFPTREEISMPRALRDFPPLLRSMLERVLGGETVAGREQESSPGSEMAALIALLRVHAFAFIPLTVEGGVTGILALQTLRRTREVNDIVLPRMRLLADVFAHALARRAATVRLRESEARFTQVIASSLDGVILLGPGRVVVEWTPQAAEVFGLPRERAVDRPFPDQAVHPDDRAELSERLDCKRYEGAFRFELRAVHPDGRIVPVEVSMTWMQRAGVELTAAFVRDITDRKQAEAERRRAFDEVSHQKRTAEQERDYLREERDGAPGAILGESASMRRALSMVDAVAVTNASVLLLGESGVGKEIFASAVHRRSGRSHTSLVKVNCASVPASLFESEFFGHARGSFTGAHRDRVGRFELADGGTLFLDEVGEIPLELQAKLLRVLQEGEFERVGEDRTRKLDVRVIAATNRDLEKEVEEGRFRRDLYFRLGVFPITVPPLREREGDVVLLARHFLKQHAARAHRGGLSISAGDEELLRAYDWPGNVRELDHVVERAVILSPTPPLRLDRTLPRSASGRAPPLDGILRDSDLRQLERDNLLAALKKTNDRVSGPGGAAELLGVNPSTLRDRLKSLRITRPERTGLPAPAPSRQALGGRGSASSKRASSGRGEERERWSGTLCSRRNQTADRGGSQIPLLAWSVYEGTARLPAHRTAPGRGRPSRAGSPRTPA